MLSTRTVLFPLLLSTSLLCSLIQAQTDNGPCVQSCFTSNPKSSFCDGDEQGDALDQCRCASYSLNGDPQIACIQACPQDQQLIFANDLPDLCNSLLFPNLDLSGDNASSATAENTVSAASAPQTTPTGSTTSGSGAATSTSSTAADTASATGTDTGGSAGSAATRELPLNVLGSVACAFGIVAWL
ncbi:uncharacterized protein A1O9_03898 [Exophiala aquamarina CBS 119918]|uniref:Extracellular membrane protein CFEM domain-containing protein n=1 Tax=Exophiala aquamarina CBS 119918 TaxID=1182545 RepID=A0A072PU31_9EURO|nr:uncharacterized protein A1O9_03898 [Exophiala aquamarina CBS 119918]KEF59055.1 hypothetical protein A1O9_03898 [Exophiala aquamarina CBS 119918]